jgi:hypothetical protein
MGDSDQYEAIRLDISNIAEDDMVSEEDTGMLADAIEQLEVTEAGTAANVARFTAKWLPKQAEGMKEHGGLDMSEVDLDNDDVMDNVGVCCGLVRFVTSVLGMATDEGVWHPVKGPGATGPKSTSDQMLMSHAPLLLTALRDTLTVLTRVITNGEQSPDVNLYDEMGEYMTAIANLHRNMLAAQERDIEDIVEVGEALLDALTEDVGIVPTNPFGTKNGNGSTPRHEA